MRKIHLSPFIKKVLTYSIGQFSTKLLNILLVPIYAYYVSATDLGDYDYLNTLSNVIMPIVYFAIWETILKYCIKKNDEVKQEEVLSSSLYIYLYMSCLCLVACILVFIFIRNSFVLFLCCFVLISGAVSIWQFSARALGYNKLYVIAGLIGSLILIFTDFLFICFSELNMTSLIISYAVSQGVMLIVLESKVHLISSSNRRFVKKRTIKLMLAFSVPLVINNISLWLYSGGSRIIIRNYIGSYENGLYAFASKFSIIISLISSVISMAVIEEAYSYNSIDEYRVKISSIISTLSKAYFSVIVLAVPAIKLLYTIAFKSTEYYTSSDFILWLLLAALFTALSNNFGSSFQVTGKTKLIFITTMVGAVVSLSVSLFSVKRFGIYGVLIGGAIGPFTMMLCRALYAKKATGLSISWAINCLLLIITIGTNAILIGKESFLFIMVVLIINCSIVLFIYRKEVSKLRKNLK